MAKQPTYFSIPIPNVSANGSDAPEITVEFNVMATTGAIQQLRKSMAPEDAEGIIGKLQNWPEEWGVGLFDDKCPLLVRSWCCMEGPQIAIGLYFPLYRTALQHSTQRIAAADAS